LPEVFESLKAQTDADWEWIILLNHGGEPVEFDDPRVKIFTASPSIPPSTGALKAEACNHAVGEILLELDGDDLLMPTAIEEVKRAFEDPAVGFVYSNTIRSDANFNKVQRFRDGLGFQYREVEAFGHTLDEYIAFEPTPESVSRIWCAPDHLRAYRASVYREAGGLNPGLKVLDDLDLMCRLYTRTSFRHIDKPLYVYRIHGGNFWLKNCDDIQRSVWPMYDQYIQGMVEHWSRARGLRLIELGGRMNAKPGYETVDRNGADIRCDLNSRWPFDDNSVGVIRAYDVFEHLDDSVHTMRQASRVLVPGGWIFCAVPSTDGRGAFQDPTHRSFWNENSFFYYSQTRWAQYIDRPVSFQAVRLLTTEKDPNQCCWVRADLLNLKGGYRPYGLIEI